MTEPTMRTDTSHVPDGEFWARFFPTPAPGDDTIYFDACPADPGLHHDDALELPSEQGHPPGHGGRWFWVVWWRGRPAVSGWAVSDAHAAVDAAATTAAPVTRRPGPAALYLAAIVAD